MFFAQQMFPGSTGGTARHPTVRIKWPKNVNKIVMEYSFRSKSFVDDGKTIREYMQRMMKRWKEHRAFEITEQRLRDQVRDVRKNGWLSDLELEDSRRMREA